MSSSSDMNTPFRLLIFDFDGTLCDSAPGIHHAVNQVLELHAVPSVTLETTKLHIGNGLVSLISEIMPQWNDDSHQLEKVKNQFYNLYEEVFLKSIQLYPGAIEFLKSWPHQLAIVSNKSESFLKRTVEACELKDIPWVQVIGGDSLPYKKPHPLPLQRVMEMADVSPDQTIMVGDGAPDIGAAQAAQVRSIAAGFGYAPLSELMRLGASSSFRNYCDLPSVLHTLSIS